MAKKRGRPTTAASGTNRPGDAGTQPAPADTAPVVSSADPEHVTRGEFNTIRKMVEQLAIKVGI